MSRYIGDYCPACGAKTEIRTLEGRQRPVCPACRHVLYFDPKSAAVNFITRGNDEEALLIQRGIEPGLGLWALPGGYIDVDEHPQQAARREALEETGLEVEIVRLLDVFHDVDDGGVITIAYLSRAVGGDLRPDDDAQQARWFRRGDAMPELVFVSTRVLVARWQRGEL